MIVSVTSTALVRELDGEAVVLDLESGMYYGLNEVGAWIWRHVSLAGGTSLRALAAAVADEFGLDPADAERDVAAFVESLRANRLADVRG
jgi:hypothetical protein